MVHCRSVYLSVRLSICPSVRLYICPSACLYRLSIFPFVCLSFCLFACLIYLLSSVYPSTHLSVCLFVRLVHHHCSGLTLVPLFQFFRIFSALLAFEPRAISTVEDSSLLDRRPDWSAPVPLEFSCSGRRMPFLTTSTPQELPAYNFSFAMGGWLMIYNFGVAKCLLDHRLHDVHPDQSVIGSSAGSLAATALVLEADIDKVGRA